MILMELKNVKVGQTVKFWYNGGSKLEYRTVKVAHVDDGGLEGDTKERNNEYRRYNSHSMGSIYLIADVAKDKVVSTISLPTMKNQLRTLVNGVAVDVMTAEQLAQVYDKLYHRTSANRTTKWNATQAVFEVVETKTFAETVKENIVVNLDTVKVGSTIVSNWSELVAALKKVFAV